MIEFLRAFARPYAAILVAGTAIISFMFGERAAKKPKE